MTIIALTATALCDYCGLETTVQLSPRVWPKNDDPVSTSLERRGWIWFDGKDICPNCYDGMTAKGVADYKAYHQGEGIHTP